MENVTLFRFISNINLIKFTNVVKIKIKLTHEMLYYYKLYCLFQIALKVRKMIFLNLKIRGRKNFLVIYELPLEMPCQVKALSFDKGF